MNELSIFSIYTVVLFGGTYLYSLSLSTVVYTSTTSSSPTANTLHSLKLHLHRAVNPSLTTNISYQCSLHHLRHTPSPCSACPVLQVLLVPLQQTPPEFIRASTSYPNFLPFIFHNDSLFFNLASGLCFFLLVQRLFKCHHSLCYSVLVYIGK